MERLNRTTAPQAKTYTEKIIQFGEGNFLRAFIEWIIWKTNQKTDFNGSVVGLPSDGLFTRWRRRIPGHAGSIEGRRNDS